MNIRPRSRIKNKISHLLNKARKKLENEYGGDIERNGERHFMEELAREYSGRGMVAFDVGANIGDYADILWKEVQKNNGTLDLHAFEPLAHYQGIGTSNAVAVSDEDGHVKMFSRGDEATSSIYRGKNLDKKHGSVREVTVPTIRLDTYIRTHKIPRIDLLKLDVQGHELKVLKGLGEYLRPDFVKYIHFEYDSTYIDAATRLLNMYEILEAKGYRVCKMYPRHLELTPYQHERENFNYANYVAL
jgi:FkbM family methyltransferase